MTAFILTLASLAIGVETRPPLVLVPEASTAEQCFVVERLASVIALTPGVRILRARIASGETLDAARLRTGADLAVDGARRENAGTESIALELARAGSPAAKKDTSGTQPADRTFTLLTELWPKDAPPLAESPGAGAANTAALVAACNGDAAAAYKESGDAIGRAIRELVAPPPPDGKTLLARWARASALRREGKVRPAVELLRGIVIALSRGESAPIWRRVPGSAPASSLDLFGGTLIAFEGGVFRAIDVATGHDRWRLELGKSEPNLVDAGGGLVLAALEREIVAIDLADGRIPWRVAIDRPSPEIAQASGRIFAAGEAEVLALDRVKGEIVWRHDPLADMISGPMLAGASLAVGAESAVVLLDPLKGEVVKRIDLGDEISAPLTVTPMGSVWAMVGGDQIVLLDPATGEIRMRANDLPGAEWPPALASDQLVIAFRRGARRTVAFLDPAAKNGVRRMFPGAAPPLVALPSFAGVLHIEERPQAIVARDLDGNVLWRAPERAKITALAAAGDVVLTAAGQRVRIVEPRKGAAIAEVNLSEPIRRVVLGPAGGAVLTENGTIYGLQSLADLRPKAWLRSARIELGTSLLEMNDLNGAAAIAKQLLERDPDDLDGLAIAAAADEKLRPKDAAERWRKVAIAAPRGDPLQAEAERALQTLAGVDARIVLERPILDVIPNGAESIVVRDETGLTGLVLQPSLVPLWVKKGPKDVRALLTGHVLAGDELLRARDGTSVRKPAIDAGTLSRGGMLLRLSGGKLVREDAEGKPVWSQTFDAAELAVLDAGERYVIVAGSPSGEDRTIAQVLRADSGDRVWLLPLGEEIRGAWCSGAEVLVALEKKLIALDAETGKQLFTVAIPPGDVERALPVAKGWLVVSGQKLRLVDRTRGRVLSQIVLPAAPAALEVVQPETPAGAKVAPAEVAIAALANGTLAAIDLGTGTIAGRLDFGPITKLERAGTSVLALEETGALLVIDAARKLRR